MHCHYFLIDDNFNNATKTPERYLTDMTGVPYNLDTKLYTLLTHGYL